MNEKSEFWIDLIGEKDLDKIMPEDEGKNINIKDSKVESIDNSANISKITSKNDNKKNRSNVLDSLPEGNKEYKKFYKGIYFDEDIHNILNSLVKKKGGGRQNIQSRIVNDCLRESFEKRDLL